MKSKIIVKTCLMSNEGEYSVGVLSISEEFHYVLNSIIDFLVLETKSLRGGLDLTLLADHFNHKLISCNVLEEREEGE